MIFTKFSVPRTSKLTTNSCACALLSFTRGTKSFRDWNDAKHPVKFKNKTINLKKDEKTEQIFKYLHFLERRLCLKISIFEGGEKRKTPF